MKNHNKIQAIDVNYITANRTIETYLVYLKNEEKAFFVYNYKGIAYRVFDSITDLIYSLTTDIDKSKLFNTEEEVDNYLTNYPTNINYCNECGHELKSL